MSPERLRVALFGLGGVGRALLELLVERDAPVEVVAAADSRGVVVGRFDPRGLLAAKRAGHLPGRVERLAPDEALAASDARAAVDVCSCDFWSAEPSRAILLAALDRGVPAVTANKAPLARHWEDLRKRARAGATVLYSAAAGAALPAVAVARALARTDRVASFEAVLTGTSSYVLDRMEAGASLGEAVAEARAAGIAEPDPGIDVGGWDTAAKLVILANTLWPDLVMTLESVSVRGVEAAEEVPPGEGRLRLVAVAERVGGRVEASVQPRRLAQGHGLGALGTRDKGVVFRGPAIGDVVVAGGRSHPRGAAAVVLADLLEIRGTGA